MTPWLRFWFPHGDDNDHSPPPRDAALWSPQAIAQTQREMWRHAAHATQEWWNYWRTAWPRLPVQPPAGVVVPPEPREPEVAGNGQGEHASPAAAPVQRRRPPAAAKHAAGTPAPHRPRHTARGK